MVEVLEQRQDLLHVAIEEAIKHIALARAIEIGSASEVVEREEVLRLLEGEREH